MRYACFPPIRRIEERFVIVTKILERKRSRAGPDPGLDNVFKLRDAGHANHGDIHFRASRQKSEREFKPGQAMCRSVRFQFLERLSMRGERGRMIFGRQQQKSLKKCGARVNLGACPLEFREDAVGQEPSIQYVDRNLNQVGRQYSGGVAEFVRPVAGNADPLDQTGVLELNQHFRQQLSARPQELVRVVQQQPGRALQSDAFQRAHECISYRGDILFRDDGRFDRQRFGDDAKRMSLPQNPSEHLFGIAVGCGGIDDAHARFLGCQENLADSGSGNLTVFVGYPVRASKLGSAKAEMHGIQ